MYIHEEMISRNGSNERVLRKVKRRKMSWIDHVSIHDTLANTVLQDRVEGTRKIVYPKWNWMDYVYERYV